MAVKKDAKKRKGEEEGQQEDTNTESGETWNSESTEESEDDEW